jgi:hypothetical protein
MGEELICAISSYKRRFPKPIGYYTLLFTSKRIIVAKTLPSWIEISPLYAKGASYFLMKKSLERRKEKIKTMSLDEVLKIDGENFEILYSDIREVRLYKRLLEHKLSIKSNETEHTYNIIGKKTEIIETLSPLHSALGEKFKVKL